MQSLFQLLVWNLGHQVTLNEQNSENPTRHQKFKISIFHHWNRTKVDFRDAATADRAAVILAVQSSLRQSLVSGGPLGRENGHGASF